MGFRQVNLVVHRWLGLGSAAVLAVVGATGAVMVWPGSGFVRRAAGKLHASLALGEPGAWLVFVASGGAILLQLGGLVLWWRHRTWRVRARAGWRRFVIDLHYAGGIIACALMLVLAVTAVLLPFVSPQTDPSLRRLLMVLHTAVGLPWAVKLIYCAASLGFVVQGATGVLMWWQRGWGRRRAEAAR
jgi:uncharacterized iron-regulated membrane protein